MPAPRASHFGSELPSPSAPSWRFVDRLGTEWRTYDRVRYAPTPTRAEFRFVPPGHRDARSRVFLRSDRVQFELRADDPTWAVFSPADLTDRTLNWQVYAARRAGPLHIPAGAATTLELETRRFAHDYARGIPPGPSVDTALRLRTASGSRHIATHARPSEYRSRLRALCSLCDALDTQGTTADGLG